MPETIEAQVIEPAPPAPPTPAAAPKAGIEKFMADVMTGVDETPAKVEAKPVAEAKPAPVKAEAKVEAKPTDKPLDKTAVKPAEQKVESSADLRKRLAEVEKSDKGRLAEIETLRKQNEDLKKLRITPEIEKEIEENRKEIAFLRKENAESAYERSAEFRKQYVEPYNATMKEAIESVLQYPIINGDDGTTRAATKADFQRVAGAPLSERAAVARQLFGDNALNVLSDLRELERIRKSANDSIRSHSETLGTREKEQQSQRDADQKSYDGFRNQHRQQLAEKYPEVFGDSPDDPELAEAWKSGKEFVDHLANVGMDIPLEERAAYVEVASAKLAAFPRMYKQNTRLRLKVTELETELAKFRASDPGELTDKGAIQKGGEIKPKGINAMTAEFADMDQP